MKIRLLAFLVVLAMIAGMVPAVAAQDQADTSKLNCLDLSKDDCTTVQTAMDNMSKITSFSPTFNFSLAVAGAEAVAPGMMQDNSTDVKGSGAIVIDPATITSDTPYKAVSVSFEITGNSTTGGKDEPFDVSFVMVDGVVYWQKDGKWEGVAVEDMMKYMQQPGALENLNIPGMSFMGMSMPPEMLSGMMGQMGQLGQMSPLGAGPTAGPANMNADSAKLLALLQIPGFLKQERLDDETLMGSTMQVYAYTGDLSVLLQSDEVQKALGELVSGGSGQATGASGQMALMIPVLLQSTTGTVTLTRWINPDDQFLHQVSLTLDASLDLYGGTTANSKVTPIPPITFKVNFTFAMDKINSTTAPTAPEGATMMQPQDLFPTPESTPAQ